MNPPDSRRLGRTLIAASVLGFVVFTAVTWAIAPPLTESTAAADAATWYSSGHGGAPGGVYRLDTDGHETWRYETDTQYSFDVEVRGPTSVRTTFIQPETDCAPYSPPCARTGVRVVNTTTKAVTWEWSYVIPQRRNTELHDAQFIRDGRELLVADMAHERLLSVNTTTGAVVWQWNASQVYVAPTDPAHTDWLHLNDVDVIRPGVYLLSVRNANQLLVIDRSCACVTETINPTGSGQKLTRQHNPQWLGAGRVLVADSGNDRVVELEHNATTDRWEIVWALYSAGDVSFDWPRDADRLPNGNTLITDTRNARLVEVDRDGTVVWSTEVREAPYEADRGGHEYPAGPAYGAGRTAAGLQQPFAAVDRLYGGLRHAVVLPHWVTEWHVLAFLVAVVGVGLGSGLLVRARRVG